MRRRKQTERYYCPKCGNKTLVAATSWQRDSTGGHKSFRVWQCRHNSGSKDLQRRLDNGWLYNDASIARAKNKVAACPPCNCEIQAQGRDAEISDYGTILDKIVRADNNFKDWLLETDHHIHKKGFEVIHQTDFMTVVRLRDQQGVGVWVYWEADRDSDQLLGRSALQHQCALYVRFRGVSLRAIFYDRRFALWKKDSDTMLFSGKSLGKRMKAKIVEWATAFEAEFPKLLQETRNQKGRWEGEEAELKSELRSITNELVVNTYDGELATCRIALSRGVTPQQAKEIARIISGERSQLCP